MLSIEFAYNRSVYLVIEKTLFKMILRFLSTFYIELADKMSAQEEKNQLIRERVK